jgi:hypothetical protein
MKQPDDTAELLPGRAADSSPKAPAKARLLTLDALDRRTAAYQGVRKGIQAIEADLGGPAHLSHAERSLVQRCAILAAMLTDQETAYLAGAPIDPANYCTLVNALRRTLETVGLKRIARDITPSVADYVAHLAAEEKAAGA